jgi:hypothetical protein
MSRSVAVRWHGCSLNHHVALLRPAGFHAPAASLIRYCQLLLLVTGVIRPTTSLAQAFREVSRSAGIDHVCYDPNRVCGGAAFLDYDGDGWEDLYVTGGLRPDRLYGNRRDGTFDDRTAPAGLDLLDEVTTVGVTAGDLDNDGDPDLFVTTAEGFRNYLLRNNGDGTFTDVSEVAGITGHAWSTAVGLADLDGDGWLDIYVGNYALYDGLPYDEHLTGGIRNQLYRNNRDGTFTEDAASLGADNSEGLTLALALADLDRDVRPELYIANDFGQIFLPNALLSHRADGFADIAAMSGTDAGMNGMGIAIGDYDEDGDFDLYVTNIDRNQLFDGVSRSPLRFEDVAVARAVADSFLTSWGTAFLDYDNDTYLDLVVANGRVLPSYNLADPKRALRLIEPQENRLYRGSAGGNLSDVSKAAGVTDTTRGRGVAYADYDNDGDLDLFVAVVSKDERTADHSLLYRNETGSRLNWLKIELIGTESNRDAIGSTVEVMAGGRRWLRAVAGGTSYLSRHTRLVQFGLGDRAVVDSLIVYWPSGRRESFGNVGANQTVRIVEGGG